MYYEEVFKALNKNKVKYLIIGGMAVSFYGFSRLTILFQVNPDPKGLFFLKMNWMKLMFSWVKCLILKNLIEIEKFLNPEKSVSPLSHTMI